MLLPDAGELERCVLGNSCLDALHIFFIEGGRSRIRESHQLGVLLICEG